MSSNAREQRSHRPAARRTRRPTRPTSSSASSASSSAALPTGLDLSLSSNPNPAAPPTGFDLSLSSNPNPAAPPTGFDLSLSSNPNPAAAAAATDEPGYCTENQLEELLLKNLEFAYNEALARLVSLGYDEALALRAILTNGHCYGSMDVISNILHNAGGFLTAPPERSPPSAPFADLRHLQEYSLAGLVCLMQQVRPNLSRGEAMWCLLVAGLHVGHATAVHLPHPQFSLGTSTAEPTPHRHFDVGKLPLNGNNIDIGSPPPPLDQPQDTDIVASVMQSLESMNITEDNVPEAEDDNKKEMILDLVRQIRDLEEQVKERREWAQKKSLQAAWRLNKDLTELMLLRAEREEQQWGKPAKQVLESPMMKQLAEMEAALKKVSGQVTRAHEVVHRLEMENAEIRAEIEAAKLSASESIRTRKEATKREKKSLKRLQAWEKQREKLQEEIAEEKRQIAQKQQELTAVLEAQKETEIKWRQEIKAKEQAISLVEEERRAKEASEVNIKRKHEALQQKIEIDFQRHKDDIQRLEEELSRLKALAGSSQVSNPISNTLGSGEAVVSRPLKETDQKTLKGLKKPQVPFRKINRNRECIICMQEEVSVVFLPCAHQVLCVSCNKEHEKRVNASCPWCEVQIEERIRVYGTAA